ncbi:MAG: response regulator [Spirochaetaceae bacterium]|nr:response regulator [Spirochaetaceae bacterium]MDT8298759.1 response regulator [Spirochaetaceae bacterium]
MELNHVLIVDDSTTSRLIIRRCFNMAGYGEAEYIEAEDGISGLAELADRKFDVIVTDVNMPKMDGRTFIRKLALNGVTQAIPIIVITSQGDEATAASLMDAGAAMVLAKPVSPAKIVDALDRISGNGGIQ